MKEIDSGYNNTEKFGKPGLINLTIISNNKKE